MATELFEFTEEAFDEIALSIDSGVDGTSDAALRGTWDIGLSAGAADQIDHGV
jgi:hypothetical protein